MYKRNQMKNGFTAMALLVGACVVVCLPASSDGFHIRPHLQNVTQDGVTVSWETTEAGQGVVEYGLSGAYGSQAGGTGENTIHLVRLTGLEPETTYSYRVRAGEDAASGNFTTAPATDREIVFVVFGDSRRWEKRFEETGMAAHALQWEPEFFINMGDLVNSGHKYEQWPEHFERFGELTGRYMMLTARGNHEGSMIHDVDNDWFGKYHDFPGEGEPYASFDWGNTHIVLLSYEQTKDAVGWLDDHLSRVDKQWVIVAQHYPMYCTGYHSPVDKLKEIGETFKDLVQVMDKHGVDADIAGHTHIYERIWPLRDGERNDAAGVHYVINGGDIQANFPERWTAVDDDPATMAKPTYSVFACKRDRMDVRTFCWSTVANAIVEIDHCIVWRDEAVPRAVLDSLGERQGDDLAGAVEQLGAMGYQPAAVELVRYLDESDAALRRAAAIAIARIGSGDVADRIVPYLDDPDVEVRRHVARALEIAMPGRLAKPVAKHVANAGQDETVRISLLGALQFHASEAAARDASVRVLKSEDASPALRERAAYALGRVASKRDTRALTKLFDREEQPYVMARLAYTLNSVTGVRQSLDEDGALMKSRPGKRRQFTQNWLKGAGR